MIDFEDTLIEIKLLLEKTTIGHVYLRHGVVKQKSMQDGIAVRPGWALPGPKNPVRTCVKHWPAYLSLKNRTSQVGFINFNTKVMKNAF